MKPVTIPCQLGGESILLLANQFDTFARWLRALNPALDFASLVLLATFVLFCLVLVVVVPRVYAVIQRARMRHPYVLFKQLCKAHGLDRQSIQLLRELARCRALVHPSLLFTERRHFEVVALPASLARRSEELLQLRDRLWG